MGETVRLNLKPCDQKEDVRVPEKAVFKQEFQRIDDRMPKIRVFACLAIYFYDLKVAVDKNGNKN